MHRHVKPLQTLVLFFEVELETRGSIVSPQQDG